MLASWTALHADDTFPLPQSGDSLRIHIEGLLQNRADRPGRTLVLEFNRIDDHWFMGGGRAPSYNQGNHYAVISQEDGSNLNQLLIQARIAGDAWVPGGEADITIEWESDDGYQYRGSYSGISLGEEVSGTVTGVFAPATEPLPQYTPAKRGEHPRLIVRKDDLPALREKMHTEFGQRALERFPESAIGLGMLYLLKEDPSYAERARSAVEAHMADNDGGDKNIGHRFWGYRLEQVAITYDLCYHAWPESFQQEVQGYIRSIARRMYRERGAWTQHAQWHPEDAFTSSMIYSGLIGMLALADVTGPAPQEPQAPQLRRISEMSNEWNIETPRVAFEPEILPKKVAYSGPLSGQQFGAWRDNNGSLDAMGIEQDDWTIIEREGETDAIQRNRYTDNNHAICVNRASGTTFDSWNVFATRLQIDNDGTFHYQSGHGAAIAYINGQRVGNSEILQLDAGTYSLTFAVPIGRPNPWAGVFVRPHLRPVDEEEVREMQATAYAAYERDMLFYNQRKADWVFLDGIDPEISSLLRDGITWFRQFEETTFATAGSHLGSSNTLALEGPAIMSSIFRTVTGKPLAPENGMSFWLPKKLMGYSLADNGEEMHQDFWGRADFRTLAFNDQRDNRGILLATHFPTIDPTFQPLALWFWQQIDDPLEVPSLPQAERLVQAGHPGASYNSIPVYAFLNKPLDMEARNPSQSLPATWMDPVAGTMILRNGWHGPDQDIVLQLTAQQYHNRAGSGTSGAFALRGLGEKWTMPIRVNQHNVGSRHEQPVVQTLNPAQNTSGLGKILSSQTYADGSGTIHMDLSQVYRIRARDDAGDLKDLRDRSGTLYPDAFADEASDVSAQRSILADYSGEAGAPLVMIIYDRLDGVENPLWSWPLHIETDNRRTEDRPEGGRTDEERIEVDAPEGVSISDAGFTITRDQSQLQAHFLNSDELNISIGGFETIRRITRGAQTRTRTLAFAEGSNEFLVVLTLQNGDSPSITSKQDGNTTRIQVGNATYYLVDGALDFADREDAIPTPPLGK